MRRFIAIFPVFTATLMLVAMMVLPHHHHHDVLVILHTHCSEAPGHDTTHHEKESCEVNLFISSIIRDDAVDMLSHLISSDYSSRYNALNLLLTEQLPVLLPAGRKQITSPPFYEPLYSVHIARIQGLRAPPVV